MTGINPPVDKPRCFQPCASCFKCVNYGTTSGCSGCPGRVDDLRRRYPDPDDRCDCKNGILRHRLQNGKLIMRKFQSNPFAGTVKTDATTEYESDWNSWLLERREQYDDPNWDPIQFLDGSSTFDWTNYHKRTQGGDYGDNTPKDIRDRFGL